jgi:hypothetical protein
MFLKKTYTQTKKIQQIESHNMGSGFDALNLTNLLATPSSPPWPEWLGVFTSARMAWFFIASSYFSSKGMNCFNPS